MNECSFFMKLFSELVDGFPMTLDIHYSKIMGWSVKVVKRGCAADYPNEARIEDDALIVYVNEPYSEPAFDRAYMQLLKWFMRNEPKRLPDNIARAAEYCGIDAAKDAAE